MATSLAGRRWGTGVAAVLVTLPIVAGPILVVLYLEQGPAFAARAATTSLLGIVALGAFGVVFAAAARRLPWAGTLVLSWVAVLAIDLALFRVRLPAAVGLLLAVAAVQGAAAILRRRIAPGAAAVGHRPWWDLPARAMATAALVLVLTGAASLLGPELAGILTPFPVAVSVVCAFVLAQEGAAAATVLLEGILRGLTGFAVFCFGVAVLVPRLSPAPAFTLATLAAVAVPLVAAGVNRRRGPGRAARRAPG